MEKAFSQREYEALLGELFVRFPSVQKDGFTPGAYKPGLQGMMAFDASLSHPWRNYRIVHVAGTNGKGSVCSMIAAGLCAAGYRVGLYTSPHLIDFRERMNIPGEGLIPKEDVWEFLNDFDLDGLSFFEITTGMAFWWFAKRRVDYAVIEVGLGGLLDSTNIVTPELSVITSIGLDHCDILGHSRVRIAEQKAGIFKEGVPAIVGFRDGETCGVFEKKASELHSPLYFVERDSDSDIELDLHSPCRKRNLAIAEKSLELLGVTPDLQAIASTARITGLRGRWEKLMDSPEVIADIGHNPAALAINFAALEAMGRPLVIVYGVMADKDLDSIAPLMPAGARYVLCAPATPRALPADMLHLRL
ncbi:MAG: bifunctional folylpolyglutamate synthase/dihydrofolate synthase [Bacteroidales bacterium]|nr:bifunctional folylpolyglutamate synthase/dihydrofolate synthase [Bacteroidales bacterium]